MAGSGRYALAHVRPDAKVLETVVLLLNALVAAFRIEMEKFFGITPKSNYDVTLVQPETCNYRI